MAVYSPILAGDRPSPPNTWMRTIIGQQKAWDLGLAPQTTHMASYDTTWHHNIPWKTLRESWNIIYAFCDEKTVSDVFYLYHRGNPLIHKPDKLLKKLLTIRSKLGPTPETARSSTYSRWMERLDSGLEHLSEGDRLQSDDSDALYSMVAWQKWNIVEGPKESIRVEDPGSDDFDDFRFTDRTNYERFQRVYVYFEALDSLISQYNGVSKSWCDTANMAAWSRSIDAALEVAKPLAHMPLINFNMNYWQLVSWQGRPQTKKLDSKDLYLVARKQHADDPFKRL